MGGAVFIQTADPTFDAEGRIRGIVGQSHRRQLSVVVSAPLVGDEVAFRVSGAIYRSLAANKMTCPVIGVSNLNPDHSWTGRAKVLLQPHAVPRLRVLTPYVLVH